MPITYDVKIEAISNRQYHLLDYEIMEFVFAIHSNLGRLYDEKIYQNELIHRCETMGFESVLSEVPIHVSYKEFVKTYYMDLLINNSIMYEMKTVQAINAEHRKQALNYLLLSGLKYGKIVNMRPSSVEHEFVTTRITTDRRYEYAVDDKQWKDLDDDSIWLKNLIINLLSEWGTFLDVGLFYDAITHFRGGQKNVIKRLNVFSDSRLLGTQRVHLLNSECAFNISSMTQKVEFYEKHLRRFLNHTALKAVQWINFNHHNIVLKTLFSK